MKKEKRETKNQLVILNLIQDLRRLSLALRKNLRGRFRIKYGMTPLFNNSGFTLIELLIVVLIIAILAAIALPQYQKAVEKSKATQVLILLKTIAQAHHAAYLRNGTYPEQFEQLDVDFSAWTGTTRFWDVGVAVATKSNKDWSLQLIPITKGSSIQIGRISGPYQGAGFYIDKKNILCTV